MVEVTVAGEKDLAFLRERERLALDDVRAAVARGQVLMARDQDALVGWLRWGLFWEEVPFLNMLHVVQGRRQQGLGRRLVEEWQHPCRQSGHAVVMTSTMSSESAQHFFRRLGYRDCGSLLLPGEALEIIFIRDLAEFST